MAQDLGGLDRELTELPDDLIKDIAEKAKNDLWFFSKAVLGYKDLKKEVHGPLCVFLDSHPSRFKMVQLPRGHYKSTVATVARNLQRVCQNPNHRILIANETATNAEGFLGTIKQHVETNPVFRTLFSDIIPPDNRRTRGWSSQELLFNRTWVGPEPTISALGMTGTMTSRHYTHITVDDPISENAARSKDVMNDTITRIDKIHSLMVKPEEDTFDLIGTRWAFYDVYSFFEEKFGDKLAKHIRSVIEDGRIIFPELISMETLTRQRELMGDYRFSCLLMNNPRDESLQDFNPRDLRFWYYLPNGDLALINPHTKEPSIIRRNELDVVLTVDLAVAEKASHDRNAVVASATTPDGDVVVLEAWAKRCPPNVVLETIFRMAKQYKPRVVGVESVAYQKVFAYMLAGEAIKREIWLNIQPLSATGKKEVRIRGLQPVSALGHLYLNASMHELRDEFGSFPLGKHDDLIDALAYGTMLWRGSRSGAYWLKSQEKINSLVRRIDGYSMRGEGEEEEHEPGWDNTREIGRWVLQ